MIRLPSFILCPKWFLSKSWRWPIQDGALISESVFSNMASCLFPSLPFCVCVFQCFWATSPWWFCYWCCWLAGSLQHMGSLTSWCTWESVPCWEVSPCRAVKAWVWPRRRRLPATHRPITKVPCSSSCACWEFSSSASSPSSPSSTEPWRASAPACSRPSITSPSRPRSSSRPPSCLKSGRRSVLWTVWVSCAVSSRCRWESRCCAYLRTPYSRGHHPERKWRSFRFYGFISVICTHL